MVESLSAVNFKNKDSVRDGITVAVVGAGPVPIEATMAPIFFEPSVTETKFPLSNLSICTKNVRLSTSTVLLTKPDADINEKR